MSGVGGVRVGGGVNTPTRERLWKGFSLPIQSCREGSIFQPLQVFRGVLVFEPRFDNP